MMATTSDALLAKPAPEFRPELAIAVTTVTVIVLAATQPGFLVGLLLSALALTAVVNFDAFVYALIFFLPWYPLIDWKFPLHDIIFPTRFLILGVVAVRQISRGIPLRSWLWDGWLRKAAWLFAATEIVSLMISDYRTFYAAYPSLFKQLSYIAMFFGIAAWADSREKINRILQIVLISTIGVCLFGLYQSLVGGFTDLFFRMYPRMEEAYESLGGWKGRITSFLFHYNSLAGYLNTVGALALGVAVIGKERWLRATGFVCLALLGAAQYLTYSRGGLAGYGAFAFICICWLKPRRKTIAVLLIASILAAGLGLSLEYLGDLRSDRLKDVDDFTLESRVALWGAATVIFLQNPVLGGGVGTFRYRFHPYVPGIVQDLDAHNLYLHTLAEIGIVGFIIFFVTMWGFFRRGIKLCKRNDELAVIVGVGMAGALAAVMAHGLVDYIFLVSPQFGTLFWMLMGLGTAADEVAA